MNDSLLPVVDQPLFFLDYDGTLAPIVDDPLQAYPHPDVPGLLEALRAAHPVWIVTGRHLRDLDRFLDLPLPAVGLHGAQEGHVGGDVRDLMDAETADLLGRWRAAAPEDDGLWVEDKERAFAVHYRAAADPEAARGRLRRWTADLPDALDVIWGKDVMELRPAGLDKGTAVRRIAADHPDRVPVYLGDDTTDEDAFVALEDDPDAITVRVGGGTTRARYRLDDPGAVVAYLQRYA